MCRICGKPVSVETAKTDSGGMAMHEACYALKMKLEHASQGGHSEPTPSWKAIAEAITHEQDPKKITELVAELNQALDEQIDGPRRDAKVRPDGE